MLIGRANPWVVYSEKIFIRASQPSNALQVLEVGILIRSAIIGLSLGVSVSLKTIKPLIVAISFHQIFEGMGLGSCITEAKFKIRTIATMSIFFTLTTPIGIALGFGISNTYDENSHTTLIVQGVLNATSAGILIYMALVDLLAMDFMKVKVRTSTKCQILAFISILLGVGCMSLLAIWAWLSYWRFYCQTV